MERAIIWARAQTDDLQDADGLCDTACKLKALGDSAGAKIFANRAQTHIEYVQENARKIRELIQETVKPEKDVPETVQSIYLRILLEEQEERVNILKSCIRDLA